MGARLACGTGPRGPGWRWWCWRRCTSSPSTSSSTRRVGCGPMPRCSATSATHHLRARGGLPLAVTIHAMLGVRGVLGDLDLSPKTRRWVDRGLWVLGTVTVGLRHGAAGHPRRPQLSRAGDRSSARSVTEHRRRDLAHVLAASMRAASDDLLGSVSIGRSGRTPAPSMRCALVARGAELSLSRGGRLLSCRRVSAHSDGEPVAGSAVELGRQQRE